MGREGGAYSPHLETNERNFNLKVAAEMLKLDDSLEVIDNYRGTGYGGAMRWLATEIEKRKCDLAVELHFNSAGATAQGHEWLYWQGSKKGTALASAFRYQFAKVFPEIVDRGIKPRFSNDRGAEFLRLTRCPAIICEPFFGSNESDCAKVEAKGVEAIAGAYVKALKEYRKIVF